jgi:RNA polymerase subunit RPABC4/transcription elongation factor Spt4
MGGSRGRDSATVIWRSGFGGRDSAIRMRQDRSEKAGTFMQINNESRTGFGAEIRIVPEWAWVTAGLVFVAVQVAFNILIARQHDAPAAWARVLMGLAAGAVVGCYVLLIGYINRDAKRRGMSRALWTIVAVVIPNCLGILLYFVLRQPLRGACPQCGCAVEVGFNFCPRCNYKLSPSCSQCKRVIGAGDVYCPYCGTAQSGQGAVVPPAAGVAG